MAAVQPGCSGWALGTSGFRLRAWNAAVRTSLGYGRSGQWFWGRAVGGLDLLPLLGGKRPE
jgi:hypothetical protein